MKGLMEEGIWGSNEKLGTFGKVIKTLGHFRDFHCIVDKHVIRFCVLSGAEPYRHLQIGKDFNLVCFRRLKQTEHENDV